MTEEKIDYIKIVGRCRPVKLELSKEEIEHWKYILKHGKCRDLHCEICPKLLKKLEGLK